MTSMSSEFLRYDENNNEAASTNSAWNTGNANGKMKLTELRGKQFPQLRRQSIEVVVYRSQAEHFAAIHPKTKDSPAVGVLKLKNTVVERLGVASFQVREIDCDKPAALTFVLDEPEELEYWMTTFDSSSGSPAGGNDLSSIMEVDQEEHGEN